MVAMGRALMLDPKLLLLDEPSAGLSPMLQDEVFLQCRQINDTGVAILMVEQNARRCLQVCDRGYVLDQGRNAYTGTGRELLGDPEGHRALPRHARHATRDARRRSGVAWPSAVALAGARLARRAVTTARPPTPRRAVARAVRRRCRRGRTRSSTSPTTSAWPAASSTRPARRARYAAGVRRAAASCTSAWSTTARLDLPRRRRAAARLDDALASVAATIADGAAEAAALPDAAYEVTRPCATARWSPASRSRRRSCSTRSPTSPTTRRRHPTGLRPPRRVRPLAVGHVPAVTRRSPGRGPGRRPRTAVWAKIPAIRIGRRRVIPGPRRDPASRPGPVVSRLTRPQAVGVTCRRRSSRRARCRCSRRCRRR